LFCKNRCNAFGFWSLAGSTFPIDREEVANLLGFSQVSRNSIDAVSDRDYLIEFCSCSAILMMHLSRLCEDLILWSSREFSFVEFDEAFTTGSSMMPQKKNPDAAELVRGKSGRVYGNLIALLTICKGLPTAYNRDLQEDKPPVFDSADTVIASLQIMSSAIASLQISEQKMLIALTGDFSTATDIADYLASKGLDFRSAHEISGKIVRYCIEVDKILESLSLDEFKKFHNLFDFDILEYIQPCKSVERRASFGGASPVRVRQEIENAKNRLERIISNI